jgi:hypothetical protein
MTRVRRANRQRNPLVLQYSDFLRFAIVIYAVREMSIRLAG